MTIFPRHRPVHGGRVSSLLCSDFLCSNVGEERQSSLKQFKSSVDEQQHNMSPHALTPQDENDHVQSSSPFASDHRREKYSSAESLLRKCEDDEVLDITCVGFGPASLAIAVALHDEIESKNPALTSRPLKVRFIERQDQFRWHAGMLLRGTKMQITFIKDLATL